MLPRRAGGVPQHRQRHRVGGVRPDAVLDAAVGRCGRSPVDGGLQLLVERAHPRQRDQRRGDDRRAPVVPTAAAIRSGWKYISTLVVMPLPSISAEAAVMATSTSFPVSRASRGHITSRSQRSSGSPSPWPRNSTIGACEWVLTRPGSRIPGSAVTWLLTGGASAAGPTHAIRPSSTSSTASGTTVPARSPHDGGPGRKMAHGGRT